MKNKNAGYSLIELIIIIALMSVVIGYLMWNASTIFGYNAKECYKKMTSAITSTKVDTLSKSKSPGDIKLVITSESDGVYAQKTGPGVDNEKSELCKRKCLVETCTNGGSFTTATSITIYYNRDSGAMTTIPADLKYIRIGGKHLIELWPDTGKISYK